MMAEIIDDMRTFTITLTAQSTAAPTTTPDSTAPPGSLQWIVDKYDVDGNRRIGAAEVEQAISDMESGKITKTDAHAVMSANINNTLLPVATGSVTASSTTTCNTPTVTFPNRPDISISGATASCKVSINTGDGSKLNPRTSTVELWDGETWVANAIAKFDPNAAVQTRTITWPLKKSSDAIHAMIYIKNACGKESDWVRSQPAKYVRPGGAPAKGDIVSINYPRSVMNGETVSISCTIKNIGESSGRFRVDFYRLPDSGDHVNQGSLGSTTLAVGATYTTPASRIQVPFSGTSAKYEVRCVRLT